MSRGPPDLSRRCARCLFPPAACLCPAIPRLATRTEFLLLRHASELARPTNSGRWAALALERMEVLDYAVPGRTLDLDALAGPATAVLFPSPHPPRLETPPRRVIVLDATWAQARRMIQRIPALRALPRLALPAPRRAAAAAPLRRPTVAGGVSTIEAVAGALELLGEHAAARALDALHTHALARGRQLRSGARPAAHRANGVTE
jgi:DTW domain-containing protein